MKRIIAFFMLVSPLCAFPETELENLWAKAREYSVDLHSNVHSLAHAKSSLKYKRSLYPLSFSSSLDSSFNDVYDGLAWYTTSSKASVSVSKKNPFGNSVSAGISCGIDRGIMDYYAGEIDSDAIGYLQTPAANLSIRQSLMPAIADGLKDPNSEILRRKVSSAAYSKDSTEKSLLENVTYYYIQARCASRLSEKYQKYVSFYDLKIEAARELVRKSQISPSELWELENKKWEYYEDYIEAENSKEAVVMSLKNMCGELPELFSSDAVLPESGLELFAYNPARESVMNEIELLHLENSLSRQETAPILTLGGTFSESTKMSDKLNVHYLDDKNYFSWTFSLGITFSEFFSPAKKLRNQLYENNVSIHEEKLREIAEQTENQRSNYQETIALYEKQLKQVLKLHENRVRLEKDYAGLFKAGKCSLQEMEEVRLNAVESECIYKNLCDDLWLFKWKRTQCK